MQIVVPAFLMGVGIFFPYFFLLSRSKGCTLIILDFLLLNYTSEELNLWLELVS